MCPSRILFLDAYMFCALVECWTCEWYFAFKLISLHVRMFIPYVNEHCGHYSIVIACMVKPWFIALFHFAWSYCACFICITSFSAYNDQIVLLCFRRYLFLWFKSFLDSRVRCEWVFVQLFPTHMLSLEFVLGFYHKIAKGGDCKVEFNQPSCWLYSVPNLLIF